MFGVKRTEGGFEKLVWENEVDTLPGGVILNLAGENIADYPEGIIPEGTPVAKDLTTGKATIVKVNAGALVGKPIGYTNHNEKFVAPTEGNVAVGIGISGTIRIKALPQSVQDNIDLFTEAMPRITHV